MTLWSPNSHFLHDPTIVEHQGKFHLFFEATTIQPVAGVPRGPVDVCHYVSQDLQTWEELPIAMKVGPQEAWDGYLIYHMDVIVHDNRWYMFYTGLDRAGQGQRQQVGIATSDDGIHFTKHPGNPVLVNHDYERSIPQEASYRSNNRDVDREWFRDPVVVRDEKNNQWVLVIMARDERFPADTRACIASYTSTDLIHWKNQGAVFSPGRFHTIETPSIFEHDGRWFLIYMSHPLWGVSYTTTDPYQVSGNFFAVSDQGPLGPYRSPTDEVLLASAGILRAGAQRIIKTSDQRLLHYAWLSAKLAPGDGPERPGTPMRYLPDIKPVTITPDLRMNIGMPPALAKLTPAPVDTSRLKPLGTPSIDTSTPTLKCYGGICGQVFNAGTSDTLIQTQITLNPGERAGLILRLSPATGQGLVVWLDWKLRRVSLAYIAGNTAGVATGAADDNSLGAAASTQTQPGQSPTAPAEDAAFDVAPNLGEINIDNFIDARAWKPCPSVHLAVCCQGPVIDVYVDGRLMLEQTRHRETGLYFGPVVHRAKATFTNLSSAPLT